MGKKFTNFFQHKNLKKKTQEKIMGKNILGTISREKKLMRKKFSAKKFQEKSVKNFHEKNISGIILEKKLNKISQKN